jgi:Ca2+-binding EF-hand superfamily protein
LPKGGSQSGSENAILCIYTAWFALQHGDLHLLHACGTAVGSGLTVKFRIRNRIERIRAEAHDANVVAQAQPQRLRESATTDSSEQNIRLQESKMPRMGLIAMMAAFGERALSAGESDAQRLMRLMDVDHSGQVSKAAFMQFMEAEFDRIDRDHTGALTLEELSQSNIHYHDKAAVPRR